MGGEPLCGEKGGLAIDEVLRLVSKQKIQSQKMNFTGLSSSGAIIYSIGACFSKAFAFCCFS